MRTDPLRQLERRLAVDPADFNAIQQLVNLSHRVAWTYRDKSLSTWTNSVQHHLDFRENDLAVLGLRLMPKFVELIESGHPDQLIYAARQLSRMGPNAKGAIPALVNALSDNFDKESDLRIMRCLGDIGCDHDLVDLGIALSCESNNSRLHFEALKTVIKIDPTRFIENYKDLIKPMAPAVLSSTTVILNEESFHELMESYRSGFYWSSRFYDLQAILRRGRKEHKALAVEELKLFFDNEPTIFTRYTMIVNLLPVAEEVVEIVPILINRHCEQWSREPIYLNGGRQEAPRDRLVPLLKRVGTPAIEIVLSYVDSLIEQYHRTAGGRDELGELRLSILEAFRLLEAFDIYLVPAMVKNFEGGRKGFNLRRLSQMSPAPLPTGIVLDAIVMALVVQALSGSQKTRAYAIGCLALFKTPEGLAGPAMALIIKNEKDGKARRKAIAALGKMGKVARTAFKTLLDGVQDSEGDHRVRMATALVELGWVNRAVVLTFSKILQSNRENKSTKRQICELVELMGPEAAILKPELEALAKNFNVSLRHAAESALASLTRPSQTP